MGSNLRSSLTCRRLVACDGTQCGTDLRLGAGQVYTGMALLVLYLGLLHPRPIPTLHDSFRYGHAIFAGRIAAGTYCVTNQYKRPQAIAHFLSSFSPASCISSRDPLSALVEAEESRSHLAGHLAGHHTEVDSVVAFHN